MTEKYTLQKIKRKECDSRALTELEGQLYKKHQERWATEESGAKGK